MLTFEKLPFQGTGPIIEKLSVGDCLPEHRVGEGLTVMLQTLPFQKVQHRVDTTDAQPSNQQGGILVMVTGALMVSGRYWREAEEQNTDIVFHYSSTIKRNP